MLSQVLFRPGINKTLAMLDDSQSMFSIAVRDGVDSSGRTLMEYKRDPHGGRERLIEEFLTLIIWGFGINFMKNRVYDPLAKRFLGVKHPDLDMDLLLEGPQKLTSDVVERFNGKFPKVYQQLTDVVSNPALQQKYHVSNVAKFLVATGVPVLLLAFGVPTFNQWLTRQRLETEKAIMPGASDIEPSLSQPPLFAAFSQQQKVPQANAQAGPLRFAGVGTDLALGASKFLQNERYNTLLVDNVLSGGRISKARNWSERLEIIFREGTIIFFLYFAQGFIQEKIGGLIQKLTGANSELDFQGVKFLHERYGDDTARFLADYQRSRQALAKHLPDFEAVLKEAHCNPKRLAELEKPLVDFVRNYFLDEQGDNLILETAKACQWIKTVDGPEGRRLLNLSQKIQTGPMLKLVDTLEGVASRVAAAEKPVLQKTLKRSIMARFGALMLANAVCALFLSYLAPKVQHWITYKRTGRDNFPGVTD